MGRFPPLINADEVFSTHRLAQAVRDGKLREMKEGDSCAEQCAADRIADIRNLKVAEKPTREPEIELTTRQKMNAIARDFWKRKEESSHGA